MPKKADLQMQLLQLQEVNVGMTGEADKVVSAASRNRQKQRRDKLFTDAAAKLGLHGGFPLLHSGDKFAVPERVEKKGKPTEYRDMLIAFVNYSSGYTDEKGVFIDPKDDPTTPLPEWPKQRNVFTRMLSAKDTSGRFFIASRKEWFDVYVEEHADGKVRPRYEYLGSSAGRRLDMITSTHNFAMRTTLRAERQALRKLKELITIEDFEHYCVSGSLVVNGRSGTEYLIRKQRPTIAISGTTERVLCTLCFHPVGYYYSSWAGALCPTDEVIAHLLFIRGDEHQFWKCSTQHPLDDPQSGV